MTSPGVLKPPVPSYSTSHATQPVVSPCQASQISGGSSGSIPAPLASSHDMMIARTWLLWSRSNATYMASPGVGGAPKTCKRWPVCPSLLTSWRSQLPSAESAVAARRVNASIIAGVRTVSSASMVKTIASLVSVRTVATSVPSAMDTSVGWAAER